MKPQAKRHNNVAFMFVIPCLSIWGMSQDTGLYHLGSFPTISSYSQTLFRVKWPFTVGRETDGLNHKEAKFSERLPIPQVEVSSFSMNTASNPWFVMWESWMKPASRGRGMCWYRAALWMNSIVSMTRFKCRVFSLLAAHLWQLV